MRALSRRIEGRADQHRDVGAAQAGNCEMPAIEPTWPEKRGTLGGAPALRYASLHFGRQAREERRVFGERQCLLVRDARQQTGQQCRAVFRNVGGAVAGFAQPAQYRRRIARVGLAACHDRDPTLRRLFGPQSHREIGQYAGRG